MEKEMSADQAIKYAREQLEKNNFSEVISICNQFLLHSPKNSLVMETLASAYNLNGEPDKALPILNGLIDLDPDNEVVYQKNMGMLLKDKKQYGEAINHFDRVIKIDNKNKATFNSKGICLKKLERYDEALLCYDQALQLDPSFSDALINKGVSLKCLKRYDEALACYEEVKKVEPNNFALLQNMLALFSDAGKVDETIALADYILNLKPNDPDALITKGNAYRAMNHFIEALSCYETAVRFHPNNELAKFHLFMYLLLEDFVRGWKCYEYRWTIEQLNKHKRPFSQPEWKGEDLTNKKIIVWMEQGHGDSFLFSSFISVLAKTATKVLFDAQAKTVRLFQNSFPGVDVVVAKKIPEVENMDDYDYQISLGSVLQHFIKKTSDIKPPAGYLKVDQKDIDAMKGYFVANGKPKVGLVWAGNPRYSNDNDRSFVFEKLMPLIKKHPDIQFYSLQFSDAKNELMHSELSSRVVDLSVYINDFYDTACLIKNCDLIISVDTSVLHLAGGLNVKAWGLIPFSCDWRWFLNREDTPWYPSMRLFRQTERGDWEGVIEKISEQLLFFSNDTNDVS